MKPSIAKGFTLIELMIVIVIIGILAAIAIPAYNDYLVRSRVTELINASSTTKAGVTEYRLFKGVMPTSTDQITSTSINTQYISGIAISTNGVITITGNQTALGSGAAIAIILTPTYSNGAVLWTCSSQGSPQHVPGTCK